MWQKPTTTESFHNSKVTCNFELEVDEKYVDVSDLFEKDEWQGSHSVIIYYFGKFIWVERPLRTPLQKMFDSHRNSAQYDWENH